MRDQHVYTTRTGGKFEAIGLLLIVSGMLTAMISAPENHIGGIGVMVGIFVFLIGRFK